jgi:hypothetical protein
VSATRAWLRRERARDNRQRYLDGDPDNGVPDANSLNAAIWLRDAETVIAGWNLADLRRVDHLP